MKPLFDSKKEWHDEKFDQLNAAGKTVSQKEFHDCTFTGCNFMETVFQSCIFRDCTFKKCDLRMARVSHSSFRNVNFQLTKAVGINWSEAKWSTSGLRDSVGFTECDVSYATFIGLDLKKMILTKCTAKNADFAEANLSQADCSYTDFVETRFLHTNLTEADFTHARNYAIDVNLNTVKQAKFTLPEAINLLRFMNIVLVE